MKEYTIQQFLLDFEILFYEEDVMPFAYSEGWFKTVVIVDGEGNDVDEITVLDEDAINDTLKRLHSNIRVETIGKTIIA